MIETELSQRVSRLHKIVLNNRQYGFTGENPWESLLCAVMIVLDPSANIYRFFDALPVENRAIDNLTVERTLGNLGYRYRALRPEMCLERRYLPCVLECNNGDIFFIFSRSGEVMSFQNGHEQALQNFDFSQIKKAWRIQRIDEAQQFTSRFMRDTRNMSWFRSLLSRFSAQFSHIFLTGFVLNLLALATPLLIILIYDRVIGSRSTDQLFMLFLGGAFIIAMELVFRSLRAKSLSWFATRIDNLIGNKIFTQLLGLSPAMIERASIASQIARIKTFEAVRDFFNSSVFLSLLEVIYAPITLLVMWCIAGPLVLAPLAAICVYFLLFRVILGKVKVAIRHAARASALRQQFAIDTFEKIKSVRSYGLSDIWLQKFRDLSGRETVAQFYLNWLGTMSETIAQSITLITLTATIGYGAHLIWAGDMTAGALVASMIIVTRLLNPFYSLCTMVPRLEQIRNSIIQINKLMEIDTEAEEATGSARLPALQGGIEMINAQFRYKEDTDPLFHDLTLSIRRGDMVAVTGKNGSGKTTFLKMLKGMYPLTEGSLLIDGFDIRQLDKINLRRQIAYVPQSPDFFIGSIRDNILMMNPNVSEEDTISALELVDAWEDIAALNDGLDSPIGRYGEHAVSPTLAYKISLARSYLSNTSIMLIDEVPNTLLCGPVGKNLKEYLTRIKGNKTVVIITYRNDYMAMADTVIELSRGKKAAITTKEYLRKGEAA